MRNKLVIWEAIGRLSGGGAETQVRLLCNKLVLGQVDLKLLYAFEQNDEVHIEPQVELYFLARTSKWKWWEIFREVGRLMDEQRPHLVHVWLPEVITIPVAFEARKRGIPVVSSIRRSTFKGVRGINLLRDCLGLIPHLISQHVVSNFSLENEPWVVRRILRRKPVSVIRNGLDCAVYGNTQYYIPASGPLRVCFVGRFAIQKRLGFLIETLGGIKDSEFTLDIYGSGSPQDEQKMQDLVEHYGMSEQVHFHGFVENWRAHAGKLDLLVLPSVSEGMPNVILEAMAEGLLVVASDIPEISSLVTDGENGFLFERDNGIALEAIIEKIARDFPAGIARAGQAFAQNFSVERMAEAYRLLYAEVIAERGERE